jgi:hypothetical protein
MLTSAGASVLAIAQLDVFQALRESCMSPKTVSWIHLNCLQVGNMAASTPEPAAGRLLLLSTGATMFQTYDKEAKAMILGVDAATLIGSLQQHFPKGLTIDDWPIQARSGAELSYATIFKVHDALHMSVRH